ncbi:REXO1 [Branchiostoma lanceolatum]|uniref:REXO1 protein n=1 Tax=Branchiostoma lanceolatum TaxID=7740 RepID=A0A8J9YW07_BRALA|nr:REXO1 [Branchiostoma lanceolatum]
MFTSSGFFRDSPCPFMSEGVCDRAHCHFKHGPAQTASTNSLSGNHVAQEDSPGRSSTVLRIDIVKDAVDKVRNVLEKEQRDLGHHHGNYIPYDPSVSESSQRGAVPVPAVHAKLPSTMPGIVEYRPTPIAELKKRQAAGIDVTVQEHPSTEYDPTCPSTDSGRSLGYRPTPISDLDISDARQDPPMNKYSEAFKYQGTDMEYDPIMNYSAIPKQQKRKLPDQSSEDMGSAAQPVRKLSQNHHASDSTQGNSELREETIADNVSNNKERDLTVSESDAVSETDLGLSTTENKMMTSLKDTVKDAKQLFKSKTSTNKTKVSEQLNKLGSDSNISSGPDDIKRRKTSKHVKDAKIPRDQSGTSDKKAVKHVKTKPKNKQKDVKSEVDGNKNSSTRKNSAKEEKTTKEGQQVKRVRTENSSTPRSISKLKNTDKNSFKSSRCLPKVKEEGNCNVDLVFEDYPSSDVSDWEKKTKLKKARHEEIKRQMPEDVVYVSSTSDECNTVYGNLVEEEKKRIQYLKHSVSLTKGVTSKLSERYDPKVLEKVDWIKTKKQMLNPSDSDEDFSKLNSMTVKTTYKHHRRSDFEEGKVNTSQKKCGKDSRNIKPTSESSSHEHVKEKGGKVRTKSSSSSSNSVSKKEASNDKHRKIMACKSSRSQKKLIPKSKSPYDLTFADSDSDTRAREKSRQSKSALKKVKSCEDKDGKSKMTPGIKVSHADLFGEESEDDVSMATGDGTSQDASSAVSSHQRPKMSHAAVLGGSKAAHTSFSIHRHTSQSSGDSLQGAELYRYLLQYVLTEDQLKENGFPRPSLNKPGSAVLFKEQTKKSSHPTMKCCARCGKQFTVLNNNRYLKRDECVYHHGKLWKRKVAGGLESRYTCCQGDAQTDGCCTGELHVWDSRKEDMDGYVTTLQKSPSEDPGVFALDCEMCYTYGGMELTRVSVVNWSMKLVYETLVKPENIVIDYNTRFSGIKEEDMAGIETTIRDVQAVLLSMFSADTILLGHSLESDLLSLKIIHSKVVDTSVVFPHKMGPPFKRALRTLMNEFLQKIIQNDVGGHDSKEDAVACVDLMKWRIKEDIRSSKL